MTSVIKLGGNVVADATALDALASAWRRRRVRERWVLVHGGGPQLDAAVAALGEPVVQVRGLRVTSPRAATTVLAVLDGLGADLAAALRARRLPAVHLSANERRLTAHTKQHPGGDLGRVGTPTHFDAPAVAARVPPGRIVVVTPVGWDAHGPLNVNADEGALAVATAFRARRLVLATDVPSVRDALGRDLPSLGADDARALIASGAARDGMVPKLENALAALAAGVPEVRIGALALLADDAKGTRMHTMAVAE